MSSPTIIKRDHVRLEDPPAALPTEARDEAPVERCETSARLLRMDGAVRAIEVTCSCGEVTVLELEYPETALDPDSEEIPEESP